MAEWEKRETLWAFSSWFWKIESILNGCCHEIEWCLRTVVMLCGWDLWVIITIIFNSDYTPHITGLNSFHWIETGNHCLLTKIIKKNHALSVRKHHNFINLFTDIGFFFKNSIITGMRDIY